MVYAGDLEHYSLNDKFLPCDLFPVFPETLSCESDDASEQYLSTLYGLLGRLNDVIHTEMEAFRHEEETNPAQARKTEHTAPRLSPDVLSIGEHSQAIICFSLCTCEGV